MLCAAKINISTRTAAVYLVYDSLVGRREGYESEGVLSGVVGEQGGGEGGPETPAASQQSYFLLLKNTVIIVVQKILE